MMILILESLKKFGEANRYVTGPLCLRHWRCSRNCPKTPRSNRTMLLEAPGNIPSSTREEAQKMAAGG
jgi:hypothetical protein